MEISNIHNLFLSCSGVVIDTRKIIENSFFVALKGERFDANTFAKEALQKGASFVLIDNAEFYIDQRTILVENTLETLQELATFHRQYLKLPIVALTGSNGKTTTKELINVVLSKKFKVKATIGNLNNHIGVPLTILSFTTDTQIGIVEMGANHQKEIQFLCQIAQPDYGYITNFGKAHLEGFGGVEGVIKGKSEMYDYLKANHKNVFVNLDDAIQEEKTKSFNRITFSQLNKEASVPIQKVAANPLVTIQFNDVTINSHLIGLYNANNINAAIAIGLYFDITNEDIKAAIEAYIPDNNRSQLISKGTNEIILDAYNANPSSMKVAIDNFVQLENESKMMILGDMFELGDESAQEHKSIIQLVGQNHQVTAVFVGEHFYENKIEQSNLVFFKTFDDFSNYIHNHIPDHSILLIKGSRGMSLERTLDFI
ncbi:MAG: UDP-N-acetylmuramoyl-tripeptide--D-alanyl-D-alanine ligase [Bacteroidota bacterium]